MPDPLPYETIAVATTFSRRFKHVLAEARRMRDRFSADLHLIYVGGRNAEISRKFGEVLAELELPADSPIHYEEGDPAEAILGALARENIDMLVAGALEKEIVLHPFLGNVARRLVREANCSVMLFTHPEKNPKPLRRIVFVADHSQGNCRRCKRRCSSRKQNRASDCMSSPLLLRLMKREHRSRGMQRMLKHNSRTTQLRMLLKNWFFQPARLKFQSKRASFGALRGWRHLISCDRWKRICL